MILEVHLEGSLVVVFTECCDIKGDLALNFSFPHVLMFLVTELAPKLLYASLSLPHWFQPRLSSWVHSFCPSFYVFSQLVFKRIHQI